MKPAYWAALVSFIGAAWVAGCSGGGGGAQLGWGRDGTAVACGDIRAGQFGNSVIVEVKLAGVPGKTRLLAMGLKLRDGTALYPSAVHILPGPTQELAGSPRVRFGFSGPPAQLTAAGPGMCFQMRYELEAGSVEADGSVFWLALGEPDGAAGTKAGITCGLSLDDATPFLASYGVRLSPGAAVAGFPALAEPRWFVPMVGFHLGQAMVTSAAGEVVSAPVAARLAEAGGAGNVLLSKRVVAPAP